MKGRDLSTLTLGVSGREAARLVGSRELFEEMKQAGLKPVWKGLFAYEDVSKAFRKITQKSQQ